jgi:phosphoglycerol transferase
VPVFFYLGFTNSTLTNYKKIRLSEYFLILFLGCFGVYYAVFGAIILVFSGVLSYFKLLNIRVLIRPLIQVCLLFIAVVANLIPNFIYFYINGRNSDFQSRGVWESEVYAFKLRHLLFPRGDHEFGILSKFNGAFANGDALNAFYSIEVTPGIFGSLSILMLGLVIIYMANRKFSDQKLKFLALTTWVLILFGISGGFGSFFAVLISPQIRAWDRISVFISFGAILGGIYFIDKYISKPLQNRNKFIYCIIPMAVLILSIIEQSNYKRIFLTEELKNQFNIDKHFFAGVEAALEPGAAIYQLPYVPFPEDAGVLGVGTYDFAKGLLHSKNLKWSLGSTRGRAGDKFFKSLETESIETQIERIKALGYSGIYIDRRGYSDNGDKKIDEVSKFLGYGPNLNKGDSKAVFFIISK